MLAEELPPQLAGLVTVDQFDSQPGQIADVGHVTHLITYLSAPIVGDMRMSHKDAMAGRADVEVTSQRASR
ncbi:hypothetical protein GCM10017581_074750 [Dactylosporangium matsuzakiense]|uniref:Uncharacterized protein n=1 Tax=Dactylosporangium matsuzakiense TaxID=53360 RepID=A0A9W6NQU6_9ACTN|nr:hypothetical protein GCM10017581_074750 [Dactylosporangium matsuzakiense]